jgi:hypothetical protein
MRNQLRELALCFAAGTVGGFAKSVVVWTCAHFASTAFFGSHLAGALFPAGIYQRLVWGGLAGFLFMLPVLRHSWLAAGLLWGIAASLLQWFLAHNELHLLVMPMLSTLVLNCLWGLVTAAMLRLLR